MKKRKRNPLAMRMIAIGLLVCAVSFFSSDDNIVKGDLEESARKTYQIGENWQCAKQVDERMGALLFYDENTQAHRFLLYLKNGGIKGGYQLIKSDSSTYIENGVEGYAFQEKGMVLFSMNTKQVKEMYVTNQAGHTTIIPVDAWNPFALVIPEGAKDVVLYGREKQEIPIDNINVYEKK